MIEFIKKMLQQARSRGGQPIYIYVDSETYYDLVLETFKEVPDLLQLGDKVTDLKVEEIPVLVDRNQNDGSIFIEIQNND